VDLISIWTTQHYDNDIVEKEHYCIPLLPCSSPAGKCRGMA